MSNYFGYCVANVGELYGYKTCNSTKVDDYKVEKFIQHWTGKDTVIILLNNKDEIVKTTGYDCVVADDGVSFYKKANIVNDDVLTQKKKSIDELKLEAKNLTIDFMKEKGIEKTKDNFDKIFKSIFAKLEKNKA